MKNFRQSWTAINKEIQDAQLSVAGWLLLLLCASLQFISSLPHAIALRKLFLLIAFLLSLKYFWEGLRKESKLLPVVALLFATLQLWMLVISGFISSQPADSFLTWKGQWLPALMAFIAGLGLAYTLMRSNLKNPAATAVLSILIPITAFLCVNALDLINGWIQAGGYIPGQAGIGDHRGVAGYLVALLEPILIADLLSRLVKGNRLLPVPVWAVSGLLLFAIVTLIATTNRNGIVGMILTFILCAMIMIPELRRVYSA
jgi:hypothetical protein